jgi:pimeloyl-ACP methyl ester carboxylesterase
MLHLADTGAGDAILFLHGFGLDGRMWDAQVADFKTTHRALTADLPGFGRSPRSIDRTPVADLLARALDGLGVTEAHVVGLSLGGAVAADFALTHPDRVRSLALADALLLGYPATLDTWERCMALARAGDCAGAIAHWLTDGVFAVARTQPDVWERIHGMLVGYDCAHWTGAAALQWAVTKPRERLPELRGPALVLVGERDTPAFHAMADAYAAGIGGATKRVLPGAGHVSCMEEPAAFNRALREFLAGR